MPTDEGETIRDILVIADLVDYLTRFEYAGYTSAEDVTDDVVDDLFADLKGTKPGILARLKRQLKAYRERFAAANAMANNAAAMLEQAAAAQLKVSIPTLPRGQPMNWDALHPLIDNVSYAENARQPRDEHPRGTSSADIHWTTIPYEALSNAQLLKLLIQCKVQYGHTDTPVFGDGRMNEPVLEFKNVDLHAAFVRPRPSFYQRSSIFEETTHRSFHLNVSKELVLTGQTPVVAANVKLAHEQGSTNLRKSSVFMYTANVVCTYARVNLSNFVQTSAAVCDKLRAALAAAPQTYSQQYNALIKAAEEYGMLVPTAVDIGVRADYEYWGTADETIDAATTKSAVDAAVISMGRPVGNATAVDTESSKAAKKIVQCMTCTVVGPSRTISKPTLTGVAEHAGNINEYATVTVHTVATIFDLLPRETEEDMELCNKVVDVLKWHESWADVGEEGQWCDVNPINFDGVQIWSRDVKGRVSCTNCKNQADAMRLYNEWWCPRAVMRWNNDTMQAELVVSSAAKLGGLASHPNVYLVPLVGALALASTLADTRIPQVNEWYQKQLLHH